MFVKGSGVRIRSAECVRDDCLCVWRANQGRKSADVCFRIHVNRPTLSTPITYAAHYLLCLLIIPSLLAHYLYSSSFFRSRKAPFTVQIPLLDDLYTKNYRNLSTLP